MSIFIKDEKEKAKENQQDINNLGKEASVDIMEMGTLQSTVVGVVPTKDIFGNIIQKNGIPVEERRDIFGDLIEQKPAIKQGSKKDPQSKFVQNGEDAFKQAFDVDQLESSFTDLLQTSKNIRQDADGLHVEMENGHTLDWIKQLENIGEFIGITDPKAIAQFSEQDARAIVLAAKAHGWDSIIPIATENEHKEIISREAQREGITVGNMTMRQEDSYSVEETVHNLEDFIGDRRIGENFRDWMKRHAEENKNKHTRETIKDFFYDQLRALDNANKDMLRAEFLDKGYLTDADGNKIHNAEEAFDMFEKKYGFSVPKFAQAVDTSLENWLNEMIQKTEKDDPELADGLKRVRENLQQSAVTATKFDKEFESQFANLVQQAPAGIQESAYAAALLKEKVSADVHLSHDKKGPKAPAPDAPRFEPTNIV